MIIIAAGLLTYAIRLSFVAMHGRIALPMWFTRTLAFVPVAVLSAIIFPELLTPNSVLDLSLGNARLVAGLVAALIALRTKNVWLTIAGGMIALLVWQTIR